jgi:hypothetical protein
MYFISFPTSRVIYSTIFFVMISFIILYTRPKTMFHENGKPKKFGVGDDETVFSITPILLFTAILSFFLFSVLDLIYVSSLSATSNSLRKMDLQGRSNSYTPTLLSPISSANLSDRSNFNTDFYYANGPGFRTFSPVSPSYASSLASDTNLSPAPSFPSSPRVPPTLAVT